MITPARLLLLCAGLALTGPLRAAEEEVILSAESPHYLEAYGGFSTAYAGGTQFLNASAKDFAIPEDIRFAVVFGAKAAALTYPPGTHVVYALAPVVSQDAHRHQVSMAPQPARALAAYKELQPGLRRLAVFWSAYPGERYLEELKEKGRRLGVDIVSARLKSPDALPERLRRLLGTADAFWLMPDPALITPASVRLLADFSCANAVPFYAPTYALVPAGATAAFAHEFSADGEAAGRALSELKAGAKVPFVIYTGKSALKVNEALKGKCRWPLK